MAMSCLSSGVSISSTNMFWSFCWIGVASVSFSEFEVEIHGKADDIQVPSCEYSQQQPTGVRVC